MRISFLRMPLAIWLAAISTGAGAVTVTIDTTEITLPAPSGFEDGYNSDPQIRELGDTFSPSTNQMLALFVPKGAELVDGFDNYMMVQMPRGYEHRAFTASQFSQVREQTRQGQARLREVIQATQSEVDRIGRDASRRYGADFRAQLGETTPLGIFMDRPQAIGYTLLQKQRFELSGVTTEMVQVSAVMVLHLQSKILYVYLYRTLHDQSDIDVVQNTGRDWAEAIVAANVGASGSGAGTPREFTTLEVVLLSILFLGGFGLFGWWFDNRRR